MKSFGLAKRIKLQRFHPGFLLSQKAFFWIIFLLLIGTITTHDSTVITLNFNEVFCWCNITKQLCVPLQIFLTSAVATMRCSSNKLTFTKKPSLGAGGFIGWLMEGAFCMRLRQNSTCKELWKLDSSSAGYWKISY